MAVKKESTWGILACAAVLTLLLAGCGGKKPLVPDLQNSAEPDKLLYEQGIHAVEKSRYTEGRLVLQTLMNTYPDSEYLAKAQLAIADSYYKEGGTSGLIQAVAEYEQFAILFPFLPEAAYAQMQMGMSHYRRMEKPDRDRSSAKLAEDEFQKFLLKYPDHELTPQAQQRLREVQEVLAEGDFKIARYYFIKGSYRASAARLLELVGRYPLYSRSDEALWMLAQIYDSNERTQEIAPRFYSRIVSEYPLSDLVEDAKQRLIEAGQPVPQPNPEALAWMQKEVEAERDRPGFFKRNVLGMLKTGPDVSMAAKSGEPNLTPPGETSASEREFMTEMSGGRSSTGSSGISVGAQAVNPNTQGSTPPPVVSSVSPEGGTGTSASTVGSSVPLPAPAPPKTDSKTPPKSEANGETPPAARGTEAKGKEAEKGEEKKDNKKKGEKDKKDSKESSSKKKKGIKKIIPW